jgi:hypothetical protein
MPGSDYKEIYSLGSTVQEGDTFQQRLLFMLDKSYIQTKIL